MRFKFRPVCGAVGMLLILIVNGTHDENDKARELAVMLVGFALIAITVEVDV